MEFDMIAIPAAWCSPAATDARDEVEPLDWVSKARIELCDHMHGEEITAGVSTSSILITYAGYARYAGTDSHASGASVTVSGRITDPISTLPR
mgnify:CR=1 FL=1